MTDTVPPELLRRLLHPPAVTIVGASPNGHLTEHLLGNLERRALRFAGPIHLVNPNYRRLFDLPCVPQSSDVEGEPGLVYLHVRPDACLPALTALRRLPTGVVLFPDASRHSGGYENEIAAWGRDQRVGVLGPQSNGLVSTGGRLHGLLIPVAEDLRPGPIAVLAQSGGVLGGIVKRFGERGVGLHSGLEYGTECMLSAPALGRALLELTEVRALALHADGVSSLTDLVELLERGQVLDKPVVLLVAGSSDVGRRAAASHSGAAATPRRVIKGVADQYGAILAGNLDELVWSVETLEEVGFERPVGPRVAIFSDSGGSGIVLADAVESQGVPILEPEPAVRAKLAGRFGGTLNPFDFGSADMGHLTAQSDDVRTVAADPRYGIFAFATPLGLAVAEQSVHVQQLDEFTSTVSALGRVPVVAGLVPLEEGKDRPQGRHAVLALGSLESAVKIRALARWARSVPPEAGKGHDEQVSDHSRERDDSGELVEVLTGERAVRELESLPLAWPAQYWVTGLEQLDQKPAIPFPVVVKTEAGLAHRAREGGVLAGIATERDLRNAVAYLLQRFAGPVSIAEQVAHDDELFLGAVREHGLTLLLFGGGGDEVERAEVRVAAVDAEAARRLALARAPQVTEPLVALLLEFQRWLIARPWVRAVDCNPIVPQDGRLVALDVKIHGIHPG